MKRDLYQLPAVLIDLNGNDQELAPARVGRRQRIAAGVITAGAAAVVTLRSGGASGTILATIRMVAGVPVDLAAYPVASALGQNLHMVASAVDVDGTARVEAIE